MRKRIIVTFAATILSSCSQTVKRQAHFLPVMEGQVLYSGSPRFVKKSDGVRYVTPEMRKPPSTTVSRQSDGSVVVTWVSTTKPAEKLIYVDSGVHPVEIPSSAIVQSPDLEANIPLGKPVVVTGFRGNTAFIRDLVDLRPIP